MSFVRLENLNDFIQPGTACVKPAEKKQSGVVAKVTDVSLSDCLACSGCITSAESVLVQQQNYDELFRVVNESKVSKTKKRIVVSLSIQSIVSLAHKHSMSPQEAAERIASFFISIGCDNVYDINLARHLALVESYREYQSRRSDKSQLPILSSICPGWICYAEKTNGDLIIPHLSKVRSPQQIMGSLLKKTLSERDGVGKADVYHVTLMPCFDKKLEASRMDFKDSTDGRQDVDCVLTPVELEEILESEDVDLKEFDRRPLDVLFETGENLDKPLTSHFGSASGGYAENLLLAEACESTGAEDCDKFKSEMEYLTPKNGDFIEVHLKGNATSGDRPAKFAIVNGFRNIQTLVQRLKRKAVKYDYIEIMACPSGCINGGAQCRPNYGEDQAATIEANKSAYSLVPQVELDVSPGKTDSLYAKLKLDSKQTISDLLYTDFHPVPKMQNLAVNW